MSKMGISNVSSYRGAGLFEVVGFSVKVNNLCFPKNFSYIKGECFEDLHLKSWASIDGSEDDNIIAKGLHKYVHDGDVVFLRRCPKHSRYEKRFAQCPMGAPIKKKKNFPRHWAGVRRTGHIDHTTNGILIHICAVVTGVPVRDPNPFTCM